MSSSTQQQKQKPQQRNVGFEPASPVLPDGPANHLKAERVQLVAQSIGGRLKAERVQEWLRATPGWRLTADGRAIDRVRQFPDARIAASYAAYLADAAAQARQVVVIELSGNRLALTVRGTNSHGRTLLTESALKFAKGLG
jgi:pterin-4a-carbinolamine dehydratase